MVTAIGYSIINNNCRIILSFGNYYVLLQHRQFSSLFGGGRSYI